MNNRATEFASNPPALNARYLMDEKLGSVDRGTSNAYNKQSVIGLGSSLTDQHNANLLIAKNSGRMNARSINKTEVAQLQRERANLLDKKLDVGLTRAESNKLEYIRWSLDRIDDATLGVTLDVLEQKLAMFEALHDEIRSISDHFDKRMNNRGR